MASRSTTQMTQLKVPEEAEVSKEKHLTVDALERRSGQPVTPGPDSQGPCFCSSHIPHASPPPRCPLHRAPPGLCSPCSSLPASLRVSARLCLLACLFLKLGAEAEAEAGSSHTLSTCYIPNQLFHVMQTTLLFKLEIPPLSCLKMFPKFSPKQTVFICQDKGTNTLYHLNISPSSEAHAIHIHHKYAACISHA